MSVNRGSVKAEPEVYDTLGPKTNKQNEVIVIKNK